MKAKIILTGPGNTETLVATFSSNIEAFQCASLLQAIANSDNYTYYIDHFVKGKGMRRTQPDSFTSVVNNSNHLTKQLYK